MHGFNLDYAIDTRKEFAEILHAKWELGLKGGAVIANPIPEEYSMDNKIISKVIEEAVEEAEKLGIKGKASTPFLLDKIQKLTSGSSLKANIELVFNNTKLATEIAKELCNLK